MSANRKRILIVEDETAFSAVLSLKLRHAGFDVEVAADGVEALEFLSSGFFDLILLDLILPRMDGFEFLKKISSRKPKIPVVVLSNLSQEEDVRKARVLGVKDFFVKADDQIVDIVGHLSELLQ